MGQYQAFAKWYDKVMGARDDAAAHLRKLILKANPDARTLLDLGCGTGSVSKLLQKHYKVTGVDHSAEMLTIARNRLRHSRLYLADICNFDLGDRFDAAVCAFDTVNHLCEFENWRKMFKCVKAHLAPKGVLVFDINTQYKLERYAAEPPYGEILKDGVCMIDVQKHSATKFDLDVRIFARTKGSAYQLFRERIHEGAYPTEKIRRELCRHFESVSTWDPDRERPSVRSEELYFVCKCPKR